jgi:uncharacterized protein YidB (DUF937 family)
MSRGFPSMTALLGLLAIAGYQNRDKLAEMLGSGAASGPGRPGAGGGQQQGGLGGLLGGLGGQQQGGLGGLLGGLGGQQQGGLGGLLGGVGGAGVGGLLSGGLGELVERFRQTGHGEVADSWVGTGPNREIAPNQLEQAIGPDVLATLSQQTGLSREELLSRLSRDLPQAVDKYTPEGRIPTERDSPTV